MKAIFKSMSALLTLLAVIAAFTFTSCGNDDEDEPDPVPTHSEKIGVVYTLTLADAWWDFFDIEVSYTTIYGKPETKTVTKGWVYAASLPYDQASAEYSFTAKATPKVQQPSIDPDATYALDHGYSCTSYALDKNDGVENTLYISSPSSKLSARGEKFTEFAVESHDLAANSWTIKK